MKLFAMRLPSSLMRKAFSGFWAVAAVVASIAALSSCSTDVDVNGPYQERAVIYGLLDIGDSVHYIRIQKSFLNINEPDAFKAAQVKDSIYYTGTDVLSVELFRDDFNAAPSKLGNLERIDLTGKDTGIFYGPDYLIYRYRGRLIPEDSVQMRALMRSNPNFLTRRRIRLQVRNNRTGYMASARTGLVYPIFNEPNNELQPDQQHMILPSWQGANRILQGGNPTIGFTPHLNGQVFKILVYIPYQEVSFDAATQDTVRQTKEVFWTFMIDQLRENVVSQNQVRQQYTGGTVLYELLRGQIDTTLNVTYRKINPIRIRVLAGDSAFSQYSQISGQVSTITQTRPFYTNIRDSQGRNGIGILGSRSDKDFYALLGPDAYNMLTGARRYQSLKIRR